MKHRVNINSDAVWHGQGYPMNQAVAEPTGRTVHLTGQVAWDPDFNVLHLGDAAAQTRVALENIDKVLRSAGGRLDDIVAMTTFYTRKQDRDTIADARRAVLSKDFGPATTAVQVAGLWDDDLLVEIQATAVIPEDRFTE